MDLRARPPIWLWVNLLSFDAPFVALVWQSFLARCYGSVLFGPERWVLGLTVWAIYIADGLLDVRCPSNVSECCRHEFYRRNFRRMSLLLTTILLLDAGVAWLVLPTAVFRNGLVVAILVLFYLAAFALCRVAARRVKQSAAAILFTAGVCVVSWTETSHPARSLVIPIAAFGFLCFLNLLLLQKWEGTVATGQAFTAVMLLAQPFLLHRHFQWFAAISASTVALAALDTISEKWNEDARRVLADAALLTPLLFR